MPFGAPLFKTRPSPQPVVSAGFGSGLVTKESESFNVASSSVNWNGGDTVLQVKDHMINRLVD